MNSAYPGERIVKTGTFLYATGVECDIRIVHSGVRYGSGDYEDSPEVANDIKVDSYYIHYGSTTERGVFNSGSNAFPTLQAAMLAAAAQLGAQRTVHWHESASEA